MANRVNKEKAEKYLRSYKLHGRKTRAAQDAGDHRKNATRLHEAIARDPEGAESLADMQKERIDAFRQVGVTPTAWAKGLKMGMEAGDARCLRLYAEVVNLVGQDKAGRIIAALIPQVVKVVTHYVPEERRADLVRDLEALYGGA